MFAMDKISLGVSKPDVLGSFQSFYWFASRVTTKYIHIHYRIIKHHAHTSIQVEPFIGFSLCFGVQLPGFLDYMGPLLIGCTTMDFGSVLNPFQPAKHVCFSGSYGFNLDVVLGIHMN